MNTPFPEKSFGENLDWPIISKNFARLYAILKYIKKGNEERKDPYETIINF